MTTQEQATPEQADAGQAEAGRYDPGAIEGSLAAALDRKRAVPRPRPPRGSRELLPPHDAALYLGRSPHRALVRVGALGHDGALPPDARLQRAVPDGLRCLRAARGERRDRARDSPQGLDGRQHRADARPAPAHGRDVRLGPRAQHQRAGLLPLDAVVVPQALRAGPGLPRGAAVNWCPSCNTVLANEQVVDGRCERSGDLVEQRTMEQWFFRITQYADELLDNAELAWPDHVKLMQRNWIGRSEGTAASFALETRPRTARTRSASSPRARTRSTA